MQLHDTTTAPKPLRGRVFAPFRKTLERFEARVTRVPAYGEAAKQAALARLDAELPDPAFVAGDADTPVDLGRLVGSDFGRVMGIRIAGEWKYLQRWHDAVSSRPGAKA